MMIDAWNWEGHWAALFKEREMQNEIIAALRADLAALRAEYAALIAAREAVARAEEREACAKLAEQFTDSAGMIALAIAAAIRARGKGEGYAQQPDAQVLD